MLFCAVAMLLFFQVWLASAFDKTKKASWFFAVAILSIRGLIEILSILQYTAQNRTVIRSWFHRFLPWRSNRNHFGWQLFANDSKEPSSQLRSHISNVHCYFQPIGQVVTGAVFVWHHSLLYNLQHWSHPAFADDKYPLILSGESQAIFATRTFPVIIAAFQIQLLLPH